MKLQNSTVQHHFIKLKLDRINFLHNNEYKHRYSIVFKKYFCIKTMRVKLRPPRTLVKC